MGQILNRAKQQKIGFNKQVKYVTRSVRYNTIGYDELANMVASDSGISEAVVRSALKALQKQIRQMLLNGHTLKFGNLFYLRLGATAKSVEDWDDVSRDLVKRLRILVKPTGKVQEAIKNIGFNTVVVVPDEEPEP